MDKTLLYQNLKNEIDLQLKLAVESVQNTLSAATHEESKPENKYDTRGLEASYLARAQSERVLDLKSLSTIISSLRIRDFKPDQPIAITALVNLETNGKTSWVLILPKGGGHSFQCDGNTIKVITPDSPLGSQLIGKYVDDVVEIKNTEYVIIGIN
jgi:transcription elongation GreA/GreB family factor